MADFDASTPQLKAAKNLCDAYLSLDMNKAKLFLSKNYQGEMLPETDDFPKQTKESHSQTWGKIFSLVNKHEAIFHEVIEAPGKVVLHTTLVFHTVFGAALNYDTILIYSLVEEDGELKIIHCKDFANPLQRSALVAGTVKAAAKGVAA